MDLKDRIKKALADAFVDIQNYLFEVLGEQQYYEVIDYIEDRLNDAEEDIEDALNELEGEE
jgi:t-SNARE complex subunit (syntaxin)